LTQILATLFLTTEAMVPTRRFEFAEVNKNESETDKQTDLRRNHHRRRPRSHGHSCHHDKQP
jgi:hypothetical protein